MVDNRLFTGSYDGTLRVWDASGILPELSKDLKEKDKKLEEQVATHLQTMHIENEMKTNNYDDDSNRYQYQDTEQEYQFNGDDYNTNRVNVRENNKQYY